jgi:hypothetical protein
LYVNKEKSMKKIIPIAASMLLIGTAVAFAGQPERPGAFGRDRAAGVKSFQDGGENDTGAPGASEWGHTAAERGSTNGDLNRQYKEEHGGAPTKGSSNN